MTQIMSQSPNINRLLEQFLQRVLSSHRGSGHIYSVENNVFGMLKRFINTQLLPLISEKDQERILRTLIAEIDEIDPSFQNWTLCLTCVHSQGWIDVHGLKSSVCQNCTTHSAPVPRAQTQPRRSMCKNCNNRPVCVENGRVHEFCGRTCAQQFKVQPPPAMCKRCNNRQVYVDPNGKQSDFCGNTCRLAAQAQQQNKCKRSGCTNNVATENGRVHDFCSRTCARAAGAL